MNEKTKNILKILDTAALIIAFVRLLAILPLLNQKREEGDES